MKHINRIYMVFIIGCFSSFPAWASAEEVGLTNQQTDTSEKVERLFMGGTEIQGTLEKPHVVYVVPWNREVTVKQNEFPFERSFKDEIMETIDHIRFQGQWGDDSESSKGDKTQ